MHNQTPAFHRGRKYIRKRPLGSEQGKGKREKGKIPSEFEMAFIK